VQNQQSARTGRWRSKYFQEHLLLGIFAPHFTSHSIREGIRIMTAPATDTYTLDIAKMTISDKILVMPCFISEETDIIFEKTSHSNTKIFMVNLTWYTAN